MILPLPSCMLLAALVEAAYPMAVELETLPEILALAPKAVLKSPVALELSVPYPIAVL